MRLHPLAVLLFAAAGCGSPEPSDSADTGADPACADPESVLLANGDPSGFVRCADGAVNRESAATFDATNPGERCRGDEDTLDCTADADCSGVAHGACIHHNAEWDTGAPSTYCSCEATCASDADCAEGEACVPADVRGGINRPTCVPAGCRTNDDCTTGECGLGDYDNGCSWSTDLECRAPDVDACHGDDDCTGDGETCAVVDILEDGAGFTCASAGCAIGRPLLVGDSARVAPAARVSGWSAVTAPIAGHDHTAPSADAAPTAALPSPAIAAALAEHWRTVAALEHASVGSFARFTLQLLALGAPAALLRDTQLAAADEVRHAELAYGLASTYAGAPLGPGRLPLGGAMPALDPTSVARALVDEACIGETLGAAEADDAAHGCQDPTVKAVLAEIAADEARHAALAWRSLRWLLDTFPETHTPAAARFRAAVAAHRARLDAVEAASADLSAWGVPTARARAAAQRRALTQVVEPLGAACFAAAGDEARDGAAVS